MKTKIILSILIFSVLTATAAVAQDKALPAIYLKVYGGYSLFSAGSDNVTHTSSNLVDAYVSPGTFNQSKQGAGSGPNYGFGLAAPLNNLWTAGIDVNYLKGSKLTFEQTGTIGNAKIPSLSYAAGNHTILSVIPNISYKILPMANYFVYTRLGLMFAIKTRSQYDFNFRDGTPGIDELISTDHEDYKYGLNLGVQSAFGVQFKIGKRLSIFGELAGNFLTVKPTSEVAKSVENGLAGDGSPTTNIEISYLSFKKASSGTINFQTTTITNGNVITRTTTADATAFTEHVNSIVLNVGLVYGF